jgi:hypothetical protein
MTIPLATSCEEGVRPLIDVREEGRVSWRTRIERLNGRWKANDWGMSAAPLTAQHRCKLRRIEDNPPYLHINRRSLL